MIRNKFAAGLRRCGRLLLALLIGGTLAVAPVAPVWAKLPTKVNSKLAEKEAGPDNVGAYMIVCACLFVGLAMICRRSPRRRGKAARLALTPPATQARAGAPLPVVRLPGSR